MAKDILYKFGIPNISQNLGIYQKNGSCQILEIFRIDKNDIEPVFASLQGFFFSFPDYPLFHLPGGRVLWACQAACVSFNYIC